MMFPLNSSRNLKISMGTSSINGGLSIATLDYQSVHHICFPWSLFPTNTYSEKLKKTKQQHETMFGSNHVIFMFWTCFFEHLSSWMVAQSNKSPFSMTHTHDWPTVPNQCLLHISLAFKQHCPIREKLFFQLLVDWSTYFQDHLNHPSCPWEISVILVIAI